MNVVPVFNENDAISSRQNSADVSNLLFLRKSCMLDIYISVLACQAVCCSVSVLGNVQGIAQPGWTLKRLCVFEPAASPPPHLPWPNSAAAVSWCSLQLSQCAVTGDSSSFKMLAQPASLSSDSCSAIVMSESWVPWLQTLAGTASPFRDNDGLAALLAVELKADLLCLLTDVEGLYTGPPTAPDSR